MKLLYGERYLSFNVHLLLHLPGYIEDWGALWASSAFYFEGGNSKLRKIFNGTRSVINQISWMYECSSFIVNKSQRIFDDNSDPLSTELLGALMGDRNVQKYVQDMNITLLGSGEITDAPRELRVIIENLILQDGDRELPPIEELANFLDSFIMVLCIVVHRIVDSAREIIQLYN